MKWLATSTDTYIFYAAYSALYVYKNLVNVVSTTGSRTKVNASDTANTPEQAQIEKLSNASEKGDKIFLENFSRRHRYPAGQRPYT